LASHVSRSSANIRATDSLKSPRLIARAGDPIRSDLFPPSLPWTSVPDLPAASSNDCVYGEASSESPSIVEVEKVKIALSCAAATARKRPSLWRFSCMFSMSLATGLEYCAFE